MRGVNGNSILIVGVYIHEKVKCPRLPERVSIDDSSIHRDNSIHNYQEAGMSRDIFTNAASLPSPQNSVPDPLL